MNARDDARGRVREVGGLELLDRLDHLEASRRSRSRAADETLPPPAPGTRVDVDVAVAGGGLSLLVARALASHGLRVAVFERGRAGVAHREWNASGPELQPLLRSGIFDQGSLDRTVVARYREGICRFHGGGAYPVTGVLDHAVDAGAFLGHLRAGCEAMGVGIHDGHTLVGVGSGDRLVTARFARREGGPVDVVARVLVDARGASSPHASADLVCPTVGGVMAGLAEGDAPDEVNPEVGEILATIDDAHEGRQSVWESFPGKRGEVAVYLFYYAKRDATDVSLVSLYSRYFETIGRFKRGDARLVRPTFGFIPGWSRLSRAPSSGYPRLALVGDAAARHSPLTFCGFGAMLRSFLPAASAIARTIENDRDLPASIVDDRTVHALTGALAALLASGELTGGDPNRLLDAAFGSLHALGNDVYAKLLRDELGAKDFAKFLHETSIKRPSVYAHLMRAIGPWAASRWAFRLAREALADA